MHSRLSKSPVLVALLVALGCAPSNPAVDIEGLVRPDTGECSYATGDSFQIGGLLDTSASSLESRGGSIRYVAAFQVANRIMNQGNYVYPLMADPNAWNATEAEVELSGFDLAPLSLGLPNPFRVPATGGIVPSAQSVTDPGRGIVTVEVIPAIYGDALVGQDTTIVATVRLTGTTTGDSTQQTGEFSFNIELCNGCLRDCTLDTTTCIPMRASGCPTLGQDSNRYQECLPADISACMAALTAP